MLIARFSSDGSRYQSMHEHAMQVGMFARHNLAPLGLGMLGELAGSLHDIGKSLQPWQSALEHAVLNPAPAGEASRRNRLDVPHAPPSAQIVYRLLSGSASTPTQKACLQIICLAISAHHGFLMDVMTPDGVNLFSKSIVQGYPENLAGLDGFYNEVISPERIASSFLAASVELAAAFSKVPRAADLSDETKGQARHFHFGLIARMVYAALIDADRMDAALFESGKPHQQQADKTPEWQEMLDSLESYLEQFPHVKPIDRRRRLISDECAAAGGWADSLLSLHAPTGSGKTLAGLRLALTRAKNRKSSRVFYIVSYTTILDQVYSEYRKALHGYRRQADILLHHSNILPDDDHLQRSNINGDHDALAYQQLLLAERWDADLILTTQVQFFNALFSGTGRAARRMRGLTNSVIIIDEVQTVPPKLSHLFNLAINFLVVQCGCDVILSSATQPTYRWMRFPMLPSRNVFENPDTLFEKMRRVELIDKRTPGGLCAEELASFAVSEQSAWGSVLLVLNTRTAVRKVFEAVSAQCPEDVPVYLLSNDMCPAHRMKVINHLKSHASPCICVSTQLIECGVDLSFGCAIRSLAGADSIWQTAGRCNRHDDGSTHPVYIVRCREENLDMLQDIIMAQKSTDKILHNIQKADLLQLPGNMGRYYDEYYQKQYASLSYPLRIGGRPSTLVQLLSNNQIGLDAQRENQPSAIPSQPLNQAFTTAGRNFTVIDSPAIAIITPYAKGEDIILGLSANPDAEQTKRLLREAQSFSISIFQSRFSQLLAEGAVFPLPCGAYALRKEWYEREKQGLAARPVFDVSESIL